jgi:hypothetical protein
MSIDPYNRPIHYRPWKGRNDDDLVQTKAWLDLIGEDEAKKFLATESGKLFIAALDLADLLAEGRAKGRRSEEEALTGSNNFLRDTAANLADEALEGDGYTLHEDPRPALIADAEFARTQVLVLQEGGGVARRRYRSQLQTTEGRLDLGIARVYAEVITVPDDSHPHREIVAAEAERALVVRAVQVWEVKLADGATKAETKRLKRMFAELPPTAPTIVEARSVIAGERERQPARQKTAFAKDAAKAKRVQREMDAAANARRTTGTNIDEEGRDLGPTEPDTAEDSWANPTDKPVIDN